MSETKISVRILGCGSSGGVPRIGNRWGDCDPSEPKNRRSRCSILLSTTEPGDASPTHILVDTSPDMREQLLSAGNIRHINAVLFTHDHADQTHGLDDLRQVAYMMRERIPVYMDEITSQTLFRRFAYVFEQAEDSAYPAILNGIDMPPLGKTFLVAGKGGDIPVTPFAVEHGPTFQALGFRFGSIAYTPDVSDIPAPSVAALQGVDTWIIDALRREAHPTHFHLDLALEWIKKIKPRRAILTNMHVDMDYQSLCKELPENVVPAFDGMVVEGWV
ncbi:Metal-dependent hydrolases of the beta-lactamase superfamily I; PhnP protein [hydrothermal vent metagenome]|uniref:Metal-dependent hydrolases of the beta-lactamase superfamily I PhnP protein n=1 Tax=hydrothermal vent metagenome TaxID=652676 RepID=A0A3B0RJP2_9ZZZZ